MVAHGPLEARVLVRIQVEQQIAESSNGRTASFEGVRREFDSHLRIKLSYVCNG